MVVTGDLFNVFVFMEISSLAAYALVSLGRRAGMFAAYRYLILGTVGGSFYLLGVAFLYFTTGTLNRRTRRGFSRRRSRARAWRWARRSSSPGWG